MPGWLKRKDGEKATEPVTVRTKLKKDGTEISAPFDADNDEVYGGTWGPGGTGGPLKPANPFPQGTVPAGEATLASIDEKVQKILDHLQVG